MRIAAILEFDLHIISFKRRIPFDNTFDSGFVNMQRILVTGPKNHPIMSNINGNFTAPVYLDYRFTAFGNQTWQTVEHLTNVEGEGTT